MKPSLNDTDYIWIVHTDICKKLIKFTKDTPNIGKHNFKPRDYPRRGLPFIARVQTTATYPPCVWTPCGPGSCYDGNGLESTYTCNCLGTGYTGRHCTIDVDECSEGTDDCPSPESSCTNTIGSFQCYCNTGWNGTTGYDCEDIDECLSSSDNNCHINATCTNTEGSFTCACNTGFSGNGVSCSDIDECTARTDDCDSSSETCVNNIGSFGCICQSGYERGGGGLCEDIDECTGGSDDCESLASCRNTEGSYACDCQTGYQGDGTNAGSGCSDVDECSSGTDDCDSSTSSCSNNVGSFTCVCLSGFEEDDDGDECIDIDECTEGTDNCLATSSNGLCNNFDGGFNCQCLSGYTGDGVSTCSDMDECSLGTDQCHNSRATCTNTVGSYTCACKTGYSGNGKSCSDVDECSLGTHSCLSSLGVCSNTVGSYTCSCITGYSGDGINTCNDDDECTDNTDDCHPTLGICTNTVGSFVCSCQSGYSGNGVICGNLDECTDGLDDCHATLGVCVDTAGAFTCYCTNGYEGDGRTCTDIDECLEDIDNCHANFGVCTNNNGSFSCSCLNGYAGNGRNCKEIDECIGVTCSDRGTCIDLIAAYRCDCEYSYWGDDCEYGSAYLDTVEWVAGSLYWSFDHFNFTGDSSFPNQNVNASQYNAFPGLAVSYWYAIGGNYSIRTRKNGTEDCIDFGDFSGHCLGEPNLCTDGFTFSIWIRLTADEIKEPGPIYVVSTGVPDSSGFAIYRDTRKLHFVVNDGSSEWAVELNNQLPENIWKNIGFSWSQIEGLTVFIDSNPVAFDASGTNNGLSSVLSKMTVGCKYDGSTFTGHSSAIYDEMAIWLKRFNDTTRNMWMMGGWDGDDCEVQPCVEGVCWDTGLASYQCDCYPGYNETNCDTEIIECESNPCQNGGTCTDYIAYYMCACPFGYTGWSCQLDLSPNYDYSNVQTLRPDQLLLNPEVNSFYHAATLHFPLNDLQDLDIYGSNISVGLGRGNVSLYPEFTAHDNWIDLGAYGYGCISYPSECTAGLSVGLWINLNPVASPGIILSSAGNESNADIGITLSMTDSMGLHFVVFDGENDKQMVEVISDDLIFNKWIQLTFTWDPSAELITAYLNGKTVPQVRTSTPPMVFNHTLYYDVFTVGSMFGNLVSANPLLISDVVVWERTLRSFEINHMLGITEREQELFKFADHYWTSDGFFTRLQLAFVEYYPNWEDDGDDRLDKAAEGEVILTQGRDRKGDALGIIGDGDNWLFMGDYATRCISNPVKCSDGLSLSVWVRLSQVYDNDTHYIISSGEQVTRGFSIFQRDVDRLGAAVTDGRTRWIVEIEHLPYLQYNENFTSDSMIEIDAFGEWTNLALRWNQRAGLEFYKDGRLVAMDPTGYRKFRIKDDETRLILGRRNDYLGNAANFSWEEAAIVEDFLEPFKMRESLIKLGNENYKGAVYVWDARALFTSTIDVLTDHAINRNGSKGFIGPTLGVTINEDEQGEYVTLPGSPDYIVLGNFEGSFVKEPSKSSSGFSFSMWVRLQTDDSINRKYLISSGGFPAVTGFSMFVEDGLLFVEINYGFNSTLSEYSLAHVLMNQWINLAFTWHQFEVQRLYINGIEEIATGYYIQEEVMAATNGSDIPVMMMEMTTMIPSLMNDAYNVTMETIEHCCLLTLGRKSNNQSDYGSFDVRHLVIWDRYIYKRHVHKLLGISDLEKHFLDSTSYYWAFDTPLNYLLAPERSNGGARVDNDRHNSSKSLRTNGIGGWTILGTFENHCLTDPSLCRHGVALGFWMKVKDLRTGLKCLITSGADNDAERGFAILQTPVSLLVKVADGSNCWSTTVTQESLHFNRWMYFGWIWSQENGLTVLINGKDVGIRSTIVNDVRGGSTFNNVILGKFSHQREFSEASYDDIIVIVPKKANQLPGAELLHGDPVCDGYLSADEFFNLSSSEVTRLRSELTFRGDNDISERGVNVHPAADRSGYVEIGDFSDRCLSFPAACSNGVTMSIWLRLTDISNFRDPNTNPEGVGYILSSGAQSNESTGFAVYTDNETTVVEVHNAKCSWKTFYGLGFSSEDWTNLGLSWSLWSGISLYVNGVFQVPIDEPMDEMTTTDSYTNVTMMNSTLNETSWNQTYVNVTNSTMHFNETVANPKMETCNLPSFNFSSFQLNDEFSKLHLGKRNDKDHGYLWAEFADFAVWYEVLDPYDPEIDKKLMGDECHRVVVTTNHAELDRYAPWTGTVECDDVHLVDCTQTFDEFFAIISEEKTLDEFMYFTLKQRLSNYTDVSAYMTVDELVMSSILLDRALTRELPSHINVTDAEQDIQDLLALTSNMFDDTRKRRWITIQQSKPGSPDIIKKFDEYSMKMLEVMQEADGTMDVVNVTFVTDNIVLHMERLDVSNTPDQYSFPNYAEDDLDQLQSYWNAPVDSITLPKNYYDYTSRDDGVVYIIGTLFDSVTDFMPVKTLDSELNERDLKVQSRLISLQIEPKLRNDLYNPIVITLEHSEELNLEREESKCAFWDYDMRNTLSGGWNTSGCEVAEVEVNYTVCHCYHLTAFASLKQPKPPPEPVHDFTYLRYAQQFGTLVSIVLMILLIMVYLCNRKLRTMRNVIHINLIVAMFISKITFVAVHYLQDILVACKVVSIIMQYSYMAAVSWMCVQGLHLLAEVNNPLGIKFAQKFRYYFLLGWGAPVVITGTTVALYYQSYGTSLLCWMTVTIEDYSLWVFSGPCILIVLFNLMMLHIVCRRTTPVADRQDLLKGRKSSIRASAILLPLLGITWSSALLSIQFNHIVHLTYVFIVFNSLHGVILFLLYGLGNREIRLVLSGKNLDSEFSKVEELVAETPEPVRREQVMMLKPTYKSNDDDD